LQVQHVLTISTLESGRTGPSAESRAAQPERLQQEFDEQPLRQQSQSQSMPIVEPTVWRPDPLLEKPEVILPPHSEPGRQSFGDRDGAESWATVRSNRDSFETASTSHAHMQERPMSECSDRDDQQPVLTGTEPLCLCYHPMSLHWCGRNGHVFVLLVSSKLTACISMCRRQVFLCQGEGPGG